MEIKRVKHRPLNGLLVLLTGVFVTMQTIMLPAWAGCRSLQPLIPVFYCTLDSEGTASGCTQKCELHTATLKSANTQKFEYTFTADCDYEVISPTSACPPPRGPDSLRINVEWHQEPRIATEQIQARSYQGEYMNWVTTINQCDENPWVSVQTQCDLLNKNPPGVVMEGPLPMSATVMTEAMREQARGHLIEALVPTILLPESGQVFNDTQVILQARVPLPSDAMGDYYVEAEFQPLVWPGSETTLEATLHRYPLDNNNYTFTVQPLPTAQWSVKMRLGKIAWTGAWSPPVVFEIRPLNIKNLKLKPGLDIQQIKPKIEPQ